MQLSMERWYEATKKRFSVRRYNGEPDNAGLRALQETAQLLSARGVRIELNINEQAFTGAAGGKLTGTACYAAFIAGEDAKPESVGYLGEAFILECAALGLGTCWAGASYNKRAVQACTELDKGERIVLITSIGVPAEEYAMRPRKPMEKLTGLSDGELDVLPFWQRSALECARTAPSAIDAQPWRFEVGADSIAVIRISNNFGYGALDCGIAMLHMELGAAHGGAVGEWSDVKNGSRFICTQTVGTEGK